MRKKVCISISDGEVSKSVLQSDIFPLLVTKADIVLLVHPRKVMYFMERVGDPTVNVIPIPQPISAMLEEIWTDLFLFSLHTESVRVKIEYSYRSGGSTLGKLIKIALWHLGRFRSYRVICRAMYGFCTDSNVEKLLDTLQPDLIFAANLTSGEDARLLRAARKRGVRSVGMPKGWDNLTLKTFLPVFPDLLLVQTDLMKQDALRLDCPPDAIRVVGFPKFDVYAEKVEVSREHFMARLGFDPNRPLILYAGAGDQLAPHDEEILARLIAAIYKGEFAERPQILVRPHPKYTYRTELLPSKEFWKLERPGSSGSERGDFEFDRNDIMHLRDSLAHADVLVHTASTLGIEAAVFDTPSITLAFDGDARVDPRLSVARYNTYDHMQRVLATGGMRVATSFERLIEQLHEYLTDPSRDHAQRVQMVVENAHVIDGRAGGRVAESILAMLESDA